MSITYVAVARVSTDRQAQGLSPETQFKQMHQYASKQYPEWQCVGEFFDAKSGVKWEERTELQEALRLIKAGDAKILLTWDVSRTHRGDGVFDRLIKEIYSNGGLLAVEKQRRTYKTENEAQFLLHWEKSVAEYYWKETKYKTFLGKAEAVQRGSYVWSVSFGYKLERENKTNHLVQHPLEAQLLVAAFEYLAEENGKQATIQYINSLEAQKEVAKKPFTHYWLRTAIKNLDLYVGTENEMSVVLDGITYSNTYTYPKLISVDLQEKVNKVLTLSPKRSKKKRIAPFKPVMRCACGKGVQVNNAHNGTIFQFYCNSMVQYRNRKYQGRESIRPPCDKSISHNIIANMLLAYLPQIMDGSVGMSGQVTLPNGAIYLGEAHYFDVWIEDLQQAKVNLEYEQSEIAKEQSRIAELLMSVEAGQVARVTRLYNDKLEELDQKARAYATQLHDVSQELRYYQRVAEHLTNHGSLSVHEELLKLYKALEERDVEAINNLMYDLGLIVEVDFSIEVPSIYVVVDLDQLIYNQLPKSTEGTYSVVDKFNPLAPR